MPCESLRESPESKIAQAQAKIRLSYAMEELLAPTADKLNELMVSAYESGYAAGAAAMKEKAAWLAENPYSDEVCTIGEESPLNCGAKIAAAIRSLETGEKP